MAPGTTACDTMSHLLMGNYRIHLAGGWGWWWRVELVGGTRPGRCARPGARIVRSACGRDPPRGEKKTALILPHCYC